MTMTASILGGSGYAGGELLRLLLGHPEADVKQVTSRSLAGKFVSSSHPNMRDHTRLKFVTPDDLEPCDVLFICVPHGNAAGQAETFEGLAGVIIDLSADFRLNNPEDYPVWYGWEHPDAGGSARRSTGCPSCIARRSALRTTSPARAARRRPASWRSTRWFKAGCSIPTCL